MRWKVEEREKEKVKTYPYINLKKCRISYGRFRGGNEILIKMLIYVRYERR